MGLVVSASSEIYGPIEPRDVPARGGCTTEVVGEAAWVLALQKIMYSRIASIKRGRRGLP